MLLAQASRQPQFQRLPSSYTIKTIKPTLWATTRTYSTHPEQDKQNQHKQEPNTENNTNQKEESKEENKEEENEEGKQKEEKAEEKVDDTPIEEPSWKTSRAGSFQKQQAQQNKEAKIPKELALLYWLVGLGGLSVAIYNLYNSATTQYKEGQADPGQLFRKVLEQSVKDITQNQKAIDTFFKSPCVVEDGMANCQMFGNVTTLSYPLLQPNTAARLGTVYVDIVREGDFYEVKSAYVDSVLGKTFDLIEAGIIKAERHFLFDPEFSAQRSMELMQQAHEELQRQQDLAAQAKAQAQQRVCIYPTLSTFPCPLSTPFSPPSKLGGLQRQQG